MNLLKLFYINFYNVIIKFLTNRINVFKVVIFILYLYKEHDKFRNIKTYVGRCYILKYYLLYKNNLVVST